jgi:hypothetical protein
MHWIPACAGTTYALDSRLRGTDLCTGFPPARERLMNWIPACAGTTCALGSRLRGNDLCTGFPPARERLIGWIPVDDNSVLFIHLCKSRSNRFALDGFDLRFVLLEMF